MAELRIRRDDLSVCEMVDGEPLRPDLGEGEAQLLIERFALTANNVTYAALGDELGYWRIFPASEGWGLLPAWGYARALASRSPALAEGQRVYGLVPTASYLTVRPAPHRFGFVDMTPHRVDLSPVYNQYLWVADEGDDTDLVMRPLFGTSVLLDLKLSEPGDVAQTVVATSASAKTAYGLAYLLSEREVKTIGLTSAPRRAWVEGLGLYDAVLAYDEIDAIDPAGDAVLVDFAGDRRLLRELHERLGGTLVRSISVGFTHRRRGGEGVSVRGPTPEFFFAPEEMKGRGRKLAQRYAAAWPGFARVLEGTLRIEQISTGDELKRVYRDLVEGRTDPALAHVVRVAP
ncbi:MAG TPA: DUF2855 family protein [Thermoleophilaceae bacterium]|nr:DUF2855 family protein [Thermoleophilaceae bacterium]